MGLKPTIDNCHCGSVKPDKHLFTNLLCVFVYFLSLSENVLKMYQIESVFIGESHANCEPNQLQIETINKYKVGDVTRLSPNNFALNCVQCSQTFQHFPEFTLHIEEHFMQSDAFVGEKKCAIKFDDVTPAVPDELIKDYQLGIEYELEDNIDYNEFMKGENQDEQTSIEYKTAIKDEIHEPSLPPPSTAAAAPLIPFESTKPIEGVTYKKVNTKFECLVCRIKCTSKQNLQKHFAVHTKIKNISCPICMKGFITVHYAQKHIKSIHKQTISTDEIRKAQTTLKQIVRPKKSERSGNLAADVASKVKLNVLSSNYWRAEGKKYHCLVCVQWFAIPKYVQKHIRLVHGRHVSIDEILAAQIQPELKPESTKSVELVKQQQIQSLQREQETQRKRDEKSFECFVCHTMFAQEKALRYHFPLHEGVQFACPLCDKYFSMPKYVRDHMIYKHGFDKKSKLPPLKQRTIENFEYHKPIVSRFECYLCHRTYPSRSKLSSHMKSHKDIMECSICMKIFKSNESRRRHMQLHTADPSRLHHCLICNKAFVVRRYMMSHMRTSHTNPKPRTEKPPKIPKIITCEICQKVFGQQGMYNKHVKRHNKEPARYICDYCGFEFGTRHLLRRHLTSAHKISKKYFKCTVCQKCVPKKKEEEHLKFHTGARDHQCEICGSQYVTEGLLNSHKKRQHAGMTYQCDMCDSRFDQPKKLLHHRRAHPQPMEIHCTVCNLGFFNTRSLNKHELSKHAQSNTPVDSDTDSDFDFTTTQHF